MLNWKPLNNRPRGSGNAAVSSEARTLLWDMIINLSPSASEADRAAKLDDLMTRDDLSIKTSSAVRDLRRSLDLTDLKDWAGQTTYQRSRNALQRIAMELTQAMLGIVAQVARGLAPSPDATDVLALSSAAVSRIVALADVMADAARAEGVAQGREEAGFFGSFSRFMDESSRALTRIIKATGEAVKPLLEGGGIGVVLLAGLAAAAFAFSRR